jgi:translocation and assembly module TamA
MLGAARADYSLLLSTLYAAGYYGGSISITADGVEVASIAPLSPPKSIDRLTVSVVAGPLFHFGTARIAPLPPGHRLPRAFRTGEVAESLVIRSATEGAITGWRDQGHAKTTVESQRITADHRAATLSAEIALQTGPLLRFGDLILKGESSVSERRMRKIMGLPIGDVFSPDELSRAAQRLRRTGVFRSVAIKEAEEIGPDNTLDITATTVDNPPRRIGFGAELSSLDGLALSGFWIKRDLLGGAERLRLDAGVSGVGAQSGGIDYNLSARLDRPATLSADTNGYVLAEFQQDDEDTYLERSGKLGLGFEHIFSDSLTGDIGLTLNYSDVTDEDGQRYFTYVGLPVGVTLDKRNDILEPSRGFYVKAETMPFLGVGGTASGLHSTADLRGYVGFGANRERLVLAGRIQLGSLSGAGIDEVPPDLLFFSGGGGTVRGQPYQSLMVDDGGAGSGGRSLLGLSAEIRAKITPKIGAVAFFDSGYISEKSLPGSSGMSHSGAGIGARYFTGIGAIRFDVATPVDGDTGEGVQFYIGIGQSF